MIYAWCPMGNHFHLAIRTGHKPLLKTMTSLLTGYAMYFNQRYGRSGHLFQNRYKSTVVEEARSELAPVGSDDRKWERFYQVQDRLCQQYQVASTEVCGAGRKRIVSRLLSYCGQRQLGLSAAQIARYFGVSGQSVLQGAARAEEEWDNLSWLLDDL